MISPLVIFTNWWYRTGDIHELVIFAHWWYSQLVIFSVLCWFWVSIGDTGDIRLRPELGSDYVDRLVHPSNVSDHIPDQFGPFWRDLPIGFPMIYNEISEFYSFWSQTESREVLYWSIRYLGPIFSNKTTRNERFRKWWFKKSLLKSSKMHEDMSG